MFRKCLGTFTIVSVKVSSCKHFLEVLQNVTLEIFPLHMRHKSFGSVKQPPYAGAARTHIIYDFVFFMMSNILHFIFVL